MRHLRRVIDDQLVQPLIAIGQHGTAFHRHGHLPVHSVSALDNDLGSLPGLIDLAALEHAFDIEIVRPTLMQEARRILQHQFRIDDSRKDFIFDVDLADQVLRLAAGRGDTGGNDLTNKTDLVLGQSGIARDPKPIDLRNRPHLGEVRQMIGSENLSFQVGGNADRLDAGMCMRAAHERHILQIWKFQVGDELTLAAQVPRIFLPKKAGADAELGLRDGPGHAGTFETLPDGDRTLSASLSASAALRTDSDDVGVAGTAADIAGQSLAYLAVAARLASLNEVARGDKHAGRAEPTLQPVMPMKRVAQRQHDLVGEQSLERSNFVAVARDSKRQARPDGLAIQRHGTSATNTVLAAKMCGGEVQRFAEEVGKRGPGGDVGPHGLAVNGQSNLHQESTCERAREIVAPCTLR